MILFSFVNLIGILKDGFRKVVEHIPWYQKILGLNRTEWWTFFFFLQFLFEKTSETIAVSSSSMKELVELRHLYDEAVKSNSQLEQELNDIKIENTEALNRAAQDYEERVLLLLSKLSNKVGTYLSL